MKYDLNWFAWCFLFDLPWFNSALIVVINLDVNLVPLPWNSLCDKLRVWLVRFPHLCFQDIEKLAINDCSLICKTGNIINYFFDCWHGFERDLIILEWTDLNLISWHWKISWSCCDFCDLICLPKMIYEKDCNAKPDFKKNLAKISLLISGRY